ncbi:hypothetical protein JAO29_17080 [Edaphobacter sp. HDX4]|uniref:hypothetical protein n=1 Tax=Edaphobacter sp. HDX4 TaxID=2794064 RepID=UPI002FE585B4
MAGATERIAQAILLLLLLTAPALFVFHQQCVNDPDVWWHLRTGEWIVHHHAIPVVDPFSSMAKTSWIAYSWAFELLLYFLYRHWGLLGILIYTSSIVVAISAAIYHFIKGLQPDFTKAVLLSLAATIGISRLYTPRPWLLTVLFFVIEIDILFGTYRESQPYSKKRKLLLLPLIFAVWANVHIQFINGLVVLLLAAVTPILRSITAKGFLSFPRAGDCVLRETRKRLAIFALCVFATLFNPYGWGVYLAAWQLASQAGVLNKINELQALPFRDGGDYLVLFIAIGASIAFVWRRRFDVFEGVLLAMSIVISFRSQRDVWMVVIVGAGIVAEAVSNRDTVDSDSASETVIPAAPLAIVAFIALVLIGAGGTVLRIDNKKLEARLEASMPIKAIDFAKTHRYAGPLYNTYDWGGILIWDLRLPVSMDGRAALYGDLRIDRSVATWGGRPGWEKDPELARSNLVLAPVNEPLAQLLMLSPDFDLAYRDKVAAVFVRDMPRQNVSEAKVVEGGIAGR